MHTEAKQLIHACMTGTVHTLACVMHTEYECSDSLEDMFILGQRTTGPGMYKYHL